MLISCPLEDSDDDARVEITDTSWNLGSTFGHPSAKIHVGSNETRNIKKSGRNLAEIKFIPPEK